MMYQDLARKDLKNIDFRNQTFAHSNLSGCELPENMASADLFGCLLKGARISLQCSTFDKLKLDQRNFKLLLFMLSKMCIYGLVDKVVKKQLRVLLKRKEIVYEDLIRCLIPEEEFILMQDHNEHDRL